MSKYTCGEAEQTAWLLPRSEVGGNEKFVLVALGKLYDEEDQAEEWLLKGMRDIRNLTGLSIGAVQKMINGLERQGLIKVRRGDWQSREANSYRLNYYFEALDRLSYEREADDEAEPYDG